MEFNEKLQELRKKKGLTQEELAEALYVSRTAVSKWESGRGYPGIDSLKAISKYFAVSLDELLSSDEILSIAEEDGNNKEKAFRDTVFACFDICVLALLFLPFFADKSDDIARAVSLLSLSGTTPYVKTAFLAYVIVSALFGVTTFALQNFNARFWTRNKSIVSLVITVLGTLLLTVCLQPYAAVFSFIFLSLKALLLAKRH